MSCPLFVELCAGTAALSLRLGREGARPPVSRMGAKTGYADRILTLLGLVPGQGAGHYLWCEPDPGVRLLLEAYRDAGLAREAAAIIRGWADEEPRALWERLRAEGPPRGVDAGEVARWAWVQGHGDSSKPPRLASPYQNPQGNADGSWRAPPPDWLARRAEVLPTLPATITPDARRVDPREVARWAFVQRVSGRGTAWGATCDLNGNGGCDPRTGQRFPFSLTKNTIPIDGHGTLPATITPDARRVDPREVARTMFMQQAAYRRGEPDSGFDDEQARGRPGAIAALMGWQSPPPMPATITPDARAVDPGPDLPPGTVAYMDPPYVGTTGYGHDLPRSEVVSLARRWADAGATVAISEAEPIGDLVSDGWYVVEVTEQRKGQKRTFSKQQREFLTMNRKPVEAVGPVMDLFGE